MSNHTHITANNVLLHFLGVETDLEGLRDELVWIIAIHGLQTLLKMLGTWKEGGREGGRAGQEGREGGQEGRDTKRGRGGEGGVWPAKLLTSLGSTEDSSALML